MKLYYVVLTDHMKNSVTSLNEIFISSKQAAFFGSKAQKEIPPCGGFKIRTLIAGPKEIQRYMKQKLDSGQLNLDSMEQQFYTPNY